jgi:hypothetical protein
MIVVSVAILYSEPSEPEMMYLLIFSGDSVAITETFVSATAASFHTVVTFSSSGS